jgi:hypothetical protein
MTPDDLRDKLKESLQLCSIHNERMQYAYYKVKQNFPLNKDQYNKLSEDELSYLDQLIFRFSKLQDSMGNRLFPSILENLGEDIQGMPFIDILTTLEKLELIDDHKQWLYLRETRNTVTHEYPFITDEIIDGLNALSEDAMTISNIWNSLKTYCQERFNIQ